MPLIVTGLMLGVAADALLRVPDVPALNLFVWLTFAAVAAVVLQQRRAGASRGRTAWLAVAVLFASGLVWRDDPGLKLLALGSVTMAFALAAYRSDAAWIRHSGVARYAAAWVMGALHAWTASVPALIDAIKTTRPAVERDAGWQRAGGVARGLAIAIPLVVVFGGLFMAADAVFSQMVMSVIRVDFARIASHVLLIVGAAWIATGYLRGFLAGTEGPLLTVFSDGDDASRAATRVALSITETATAIGAMDLLFLLFVIVQFRYLFGGDSLVQVTPGLTYAEYARRGFFELVIAAFLVVPVLLAADWLLDARREWDRAVFRGLAGVLIVLVLAIAASAFDRLRIYYTTYGLTESRVYGVVTLIWIGATLIWLAATVLRGRRHLFAFGALTSALAVVALLFGIAPDEVAARTNVARIVSANVALPFDVAYATSMSGDAIPVLIDAMPSLPPDVQCPLARHMLAAWPPDHILSIRGWNWSAARASRAVRDHETQLRSIVGANAKCDKAR